MPFRLSHIIHWRKKSGKDRGQQAGKVSRGLAQVQTHIIYRLKGCVNGCIACWEARGSYEVMVATALLLATCMFHIVVWLLKQFLHTMLGIT